MPEVAAPIPVYHSTRLCGLELELDSVNTEFRAPVLPRGWTSHQDGSLGNGREYVLEPALPYDALQPAVTAFCNAVQAARTNMGKRGGYHVHVQSPEFSQARPAWLLARVYTHFQRVINDMLAPSRKDNHFCPPYRMSDLNDSNFVHRYFRLGDPASTRYEAKGSRRYSTLNFAMCRCSNPRERSIEYRQGSPSSYASNVFGWATFVVALTELVVHQPQMAEDAISDYPRATVENLADLLDRYGDVPGVDAQNLGEWVKWRHNYMTARPTDAEVDAAVALLQGPHGIFYISEHLSVPNNRALRILEKAVVDGKAVKVNSTKWRSVFETSRVAVDDLNELAQVFGNVRRPGEPTISLGQLFPPVPVREVAAPRPPVVDPAELVPEAPVEAVEAPSAPQEGEEVVDTPEGPQVVSAQTLRDLLAGSADVSVDTETAVAPRRRRAPRTGTTRRPSGSPPPDISGLPSVSEREYPSTWVLDGRRFCALNTAVLESLPPGHTVYGVNGETYTLPNMERVVVGLPEDEFQLLTSEGEPVSYHSRIGDDEEI